MRRIRPRRRSSKQPVSEGSWAISYGDMLTLLLGFFIMFFSIDQEDIQIERLQKSILATLSAKPLHARPEASEANHQDFSYLGIESQPHGNKVVVKFPETSFFETARTELTEAGRLTLRDFAARFVPFAGKSVINVVGFTDDRPVQLKRDRPFRDNLELSVLRAVSAQRFLQASGIPINRTRIGGHGVQEFLRKNNLVEINDLEKRRALARAIVLVIEPESAL